MTDGPVHEIHTSERKSFRGCRWRWEWIFRENYYPKLTAKPLEFGVAYHRAMEVYYEPTSWHLVKNPLTHNTMVELAIAEFVRVCNDQRKKFLHQTDQGYLEDEVEQDYNERIELGKGMLHYHLGQVAPVEDGRKGFTPKKVEIPFQMPIMGPDKKQLVCRRLNCRQHMGVPAPVVFAGRIDCISEDDEEDLWVVDWKTAARISNDRHEFLFLDDQISSYVLAMRVLEIGVRGFIYHEQKKSFPQPPKRNKVKRLGRWFSVNEQQDTSYDMYLNTVKEEDPEAYNEGLYNDFLNFLRMEGPVYWQRYQIHKTDDELRTVAYNLWLEAKDMVDPDLPMYPNPGRFSCMSCAFREPCQERFARRDYQYFLDTVFDRREQHYWVRTEASTDTKGGE